MARYQTLNDALVAGHPDCLALWPLGSNIGYNETVRHVVPTGVILYRGKRPYDQMRLISVYRDERGLYEEAITYITA